MTNERLAELAREHAKNYPGRTPERRAAAALWVVLSDTKTTDAARRALGFADAATQAAALVLLRQIEDQGDDQ